MRTLREAVGKTQAQKSEVGRRRTATTDACRRGRRPKTAKLCPNWAKFGRVGAKFGRRWPEFGPNPAEIGQGCSSPAEVGRNRSLFCSTPIIWSIPGRHIPILSFRAQSGVEAPAQPRKRFERTGPRRPTVEATGQPDRRVTLSIPSKSPPPWEATVKPKMASIY